MNAYQWKMAERVALITTLVMDLNSRSDEFSAVLNYSGVVNKAEVVFFQEIERNKFIEIFRMQTYLENNYQQRPPLDYCTIDQMIHTLNQIIKCITEGRKNENHAGTIADLFAPAAMDERPRITGQFRPCLPTVCAGPAVRHGGAQTGRSSAAV